MGKFPKGSVRAAVAKSGNDWLFDSNLPGPAAYRVTDHVRDVTATAKCAMPYFRGSENDARVWGGVTVAEREEA